MAKKKKKEIINDEEKFFLTLKNEPAVFEVGGFEFEVQAPSIMEEARLSLHTYEMMTKLFSKEELQKILGIEDIDLSSPAQKGLIYNLLPPDVQSFLSIMAFLDMTIKDIRKNGKRIVLVDEDGKEIEVKDFATFAKYMKPIHPDLHTLRLANILSEKVNDWLRTLAMDPIEVKNS